jgi:hypothetical protein
MNWELFGYLGTAVILYSFTIENMFKLRAVNMLGALVWIIYGVGIYALPTIIVNVCIILIHTYWFYKHRKEISFSGTERKD